MKNIRDLLLEYWWREDRDFSRIKIYYVHRGAKNDIGVIDGKIVLRLGKSFIYLKDAQIPYHRVIKVTYFDQVIFQKTRF